MKNYVIIDADTIQKRIAELEKELKYLKGADAYVNLGEINALKQLLSQSTSLIPEIDKAFDAGSERCEFGYGSANDKHDYISNLKLDI